jgi:hypothetical protein
MTVAHTKHASGFNELDDHGKEFRGFRSEGSIRGHSERDEKSVVSLNYGLDVRVSLFSVFRCFEARQGATLGVSYATIQVGLTREAGNRSIDEDRAIFVVYPYDIRAPAEAILGVRQAFLKAPAVTKVSRDKTFTQLLQ